MSGKKTKPKTIEEKSFFERMKDEKPGALPAIVILVMLGLTLVLFEVAGRVDDPALKTAQTGSTDTTTLIPLTPEDHMREQLEQVITSARKKPFRAKVSTENGVEGLWTQDGLNYRFENAAKSKVLIVNAEQKKLWVIDVPARIAHETPFDSTNMPAFNELIATMFLEGLTTATVSGTHNLLDILPSGKDATLTFTEDKLPDRWEGDKSGGVVRFIDWDYLRIGAVAPSDFELWKGIRVSQPTPATTTTTAKK